MTEELLKEETVRMLAPHLIWHYGPFPDNKLPSTPREFDFIVTFQVVLNASSHEERLEMNLGHCERIDDSRVIFSTAAGAYFVHINRLVAYAVLAPPDSKSILTSLKRVTEKCREQR